jgi:hypothetical protein
VRPKREGRSKGSRAMAIDDEAGRTDRLRVGSLTFEYENGSRGSMLTEYRAQERAFGAFTVFRVVASVQAAALASHLPRRERWVLLLLDGRRSVATTLARLLQWGYIEPVQAVEFRTRRGNPPSGSA